MIQIEEFALSEVVDQEVEECVEALELIEKLELEGQNKLKGKDEKIMPYPEMTREQKFILDVLTPSHVVLKKYSRTAIPLRVLQIAAHATAIAFFNELQVWDTEGVDKDPVLVGKKSYNYFLLARWGEHLENWTMMLQRATKKARDGMLGKLSQCRCDLDSRIARLGSDTFSQDDLEKTSFYV